MKDLKLKIIAALPFLMIAAAYFVAGRLESDRTALSPAEQTLLNYAPEEGQGTAIKKERFAKEALLKDLNIFGAAANGAPGAGAAQQRDGGVAQKPANGLTLVVENGDRSIAILNGTVVREGDRLGSITVRKIERDRVLVMDKNLKWIYMEGKR
ncbi:MAG: hypothetical protein HY889_07035 [Deltaproteobacteria bacterium]|nr:hypothetical protein [Deltaproteobacteria bacterium]